MALFESYCSKGVYGAPPSGAAYGANDPEE